MEEWRTITDFPDYQVSNMGRVRRATRGRGYRGEFLNNHIDKNGYNVVRIRSYSKILHRLVAIAFIPNPDNKETVDHINRQKTDNRVENLRWATRVEQCENRGIPVGITGERNIYLTTNTGGKRFHVEIKRKEGTMNKCFETLPEAVAARDEWLMNNPAH